MQVDCQPIIQKLFLDLTFKVRSKSESFVKWVTTDKHNMKWLYLPIHTPTHQFFLPIYVHSKKNYPSKEQKGGMKQHQITYWSFYRLQDLWR
jgi:hypothetical protein